MFTKKVVLALLVAFCGSAYADAYEVVSVAYDGANEATEPTHEPLTCEEARLTAWFERERQRTDGSNVGGPEYEPCSAEQPAGVSPADPD
jgi:hypothetical protein